MSLKAFHLLFVIASILLAVGLGLWSIREYHEFGGAGMLALGIASLLAGAAMTVYSRWFVRKLKHVSYI